MNYILAAMITVLIAGAYNLGKRKGKEEAIESIIIHEILKMDELEDEEYNLDILDDILFDVTCKLNELLGLGHDISKYNHTELVISIRESIVEELERQGEE